jgi:hypothetical protein
MLAQVSSPVRYAPVCRGRAGCYWRALRRLARLDRPHP